MNPTRRHSAETPRHHDPAASCVAPASAAEVNQLGIRILGLKGIPVEQGARLTAFLACANEMKRMPRQFIPLLAEGLVDACEALPEEQALRALEAAFAFQKAPAWRV